MAGSRIRPRHLALAVPCLLAGWIAVLAVILRLGGEAPAVFVPFPPHDLLANLDRGVSVTGRSPVSLTLKGEAPDLVARVYAAGAWVVLPAGLEACIPALLREEPAQREDTPS